MNDEINPEKSKSKVFSFRLSREATWEEVHQKVAGLLKQVSEYLADDLEAVLTEIQAVRPEEIIFHNDLQELEVVSCTSGGRPGGAFNASWEEWFRTDGVVELLYKDSEENYPYVSQTTDSYEVKNATFLVVFSVAKADDDSGFENYRKVKIWGIPKEKIEKEENLS